MARKEVKKQAEEEVEVESEEEEDDTNYEVEKIIKHRVRLSIKPVRRT